MKLTQKKSNDFLIFFINMNNLYNFLDNKNTFGVIGATINKEKYGYKVFKSLIASGYTVYPINPNYKKIDDTTCYPSLNNVNKKIDVVVTVVPPDVTLNIIEEMNNLKIKKLWMQVGSESDEAIEICKQYNIDEIHGTCIMLNKK